MLMAQLFQRMLHRSGATLTFTALLLSVCTVASGDPNTVEVEVKNGPEIIDEGYADTYDLSQGAYGGENIGPAPQWVTGSEMPGVDDATGLGGKLGELKCDGGNHTLNTDVNCDKFLVVNGATVTVEGDVTIRVEEEFKIQNSGRIVLAEGATLTIHTHKDFTVQDESEVNPDTTRPFDVTVYRHGDLQMFVQNESHLCAKVVAPQAYLQVENGADFYGQFTGKHVHLKNEAGAHFVSESTTFSPLYD